MSLAISKTIFPKVVQQDRGLRPVAPFLHQTSQKRSPSREREGLLPAGLCFATFFRYSHSTALVLPSSHSSCAQFSVPSRAECRQVALCRVSSASRTKAGTTSKTFLKLSGVEFSFLSQRARRAAFGGSIASKTPVLKLKRPLVCKPPAAIASELTRVACAPLAKPQVAGLRHS